MKKLIPMLLALILAGCETKNVSVQPTDVTINGVTINLIVIDSCEYIGYIAGNASYLSHKGNCKYCAARKNTQHERN